MPASISYGTATGRRTPDCCRQDFRAPDLGQLQTA